MRIWINGRSLDIRNATGPFADILTIHKELTLFYESQFKREGFTLKEELEDILLNKVVVKNEDLLKEEFGSILCSKFSLQRNIPLKEGVLDFLIDGGIAIQFSFGKVGKRELNKIGNRSCSLEAVNALVLVSDQTLPFEFQYKNKPCWVFKVGALKNVTGAIII